MALTFSERLEEGLYWIRVFDENQRKVTEQAATMNPEHTGLILHSPKLDKGTYVVTYHIISSDGHPIDGTYLFAVGESLKRPQAGGKQPQLEHLHRQSDPFHRFGVKDILQFASRIAFYLFMLTFTGWSLWSRWFAAKTSAHAKEPLKGWGERLQQAYLIVYILFLMAHLPDLIGDGGRMRWYSSLRERVSATPGRAACCLHCCPSLCSTGTRGWIICGRERCGWPKLSSATRQLFNPFPRR
ncbi:copper resistance protein CopC [Paenibacillus sp. P25]|nr:copper resistance protein CopC [Paenibacillus sp. P25]